jgi:hypothetical protein
MSIYQKILVKLLKESKKSEKNLDEIDPENISDGLVVELIKSADNKDASGVKYTIEKVGKDKSGNYLFKISRGGGHNQVVTHEKLINNYKRA